MNELIFNDILKLKTENSSLTVQNFFHSTKPPHFPLRGMVGQLEKGRECFVCLSIL